jgi:predicted ATPase
MGRLYSGLDKIKDMCPDLNLTLPQIVVIGDESTGKSSLIERIAMFSFFPRGNESQQRSLCTRMPIQLRLKRLSTPELQVFTQEHKLEYKPNHCWVRLKYEPVNGTPQESPFFDRDEVEQQVKYYMEQAVQGNNNGKYSSIHEVVDCYHQQLECAKTFWWLR